MKTVILATFFLSIMYTPSLRAEPVVFDPFAFSIQAQVPGGATKRITDFAPYENTPATAADREQAINQAKANGTYGDKASIERNYKSAPEGGITDAERGGTVDRRNQAQDAKGKADMGSKLAMVAGMSLAEQSRAAYAALNFGLGSALAAMAALEFVQSEESAKTATINADQQSTLGREEYNQEQYRDNSTDKAKKNGSSASSNSNADSSSGHSSGSKSSSSSVDSRSYTLPDGLESQLQKQGINVNSFKENLYGGQYSSVSDVLNGMGVSDKVSPSDIAQAEKIASQTIRDAAESSNQKDGDKSVTASTNSNAFESSQSGGHGGGGRSENGEHDGMFSNHSSHVGKNSGGEAARGIARRSGSANGNSDTDSDSMATGGTMSAFISKFANENKKGILDRKLSDYEIQLEKANIYPATGKGQIFQIAHRNYREFARWRKNTKLAIH